jgi:predicted acyltransferase
VRPAGNLGAAIDRAVFGRHVWVQSKAWDPEGILSTIPAVATTLLGAVAGLWLGAAASARRKALGMAGAGLAAALVGALWGLVFPVNKNLWTSSYVWFTGGVAAITLALCYALIDIRGWRRWAWPFVVLGLNAITLFVVSGLLAKTLVFIKVAAASGQQMSLQKAIYGDWFVPLASACNASLLYALANLVLLWVVLYAMYRKQIFLKA